MVLRIRTFTGPDPEVEVTKKQNPIHRLSFSIDFSILVLAYASLSQIRDFFLRIRTSAFFTKVLDFWFAVEIFKSIGRSGFLTGFLYVLNLFQSSFITLKYLIKKTK